ncbi:MAG: S8 family serine peptidase [Bacteroidales bacterium]|nr:S8 family serine peptidase [Bacteroidales bacterium]
MRKLVFTLLVILSFCNLGLAQNTIEPRLHEILNQKGDEMISVNIILKSQMNFNKLRNRAENITDKDVKRNVLVGELKNFAEKEQQEILSILNAEQRSNKVENVSSHWLANYINCTTTRDVIYQLAQHPDVLLIGYNEEKVLISNNYSERAEGVSGMTENITKVNADDIWTMGYTGEGIIVAVIDSGVNYKHVDVADHLWDGGAEFPYHGYNTYDGNNNPMDKFGHGSHCAGTICGDGTSGTKTGIAPNATLMCVKSVSDEGTGTAHNINSGMEWAVEHNADVLSMSLGVTMPDPSEKVMLRRSCVTALELGVVAAVAAGNYGGNEYMMIKPVPENVIIPGGCPPPWLSPEQEANAGGLSCVVSVGAVDYNDNPADFSSNGPVTWENSEFNDYVYNNGESIGLIRPDICAPGVSIISLDYSSNIGHTSMNGTSMATPCVAGIMCLMLEKDPSLTPADICRILETTSVKLTETKSNKTGTGRVDALAAMNAIDNGKFNFVKCAINDKNGNDNQNINAGENVNINITFNNAYEENFSNVKAVLRNKNKSVTITDSIAQIENINANENITIENVFAVTLDENVAAKTLLAFDVYFYNENNEQIAYLRAPAYVCGSEIQFSSFIIKNDNNGNGLLEAGETADLGIVLNNIGNEIAVGLKGVISSTNSKLTINTSEAEFNSIGENASAVALFNVTLAENAGDNFKLPIEINVSDAFNNTYKFEGTYKKACEISFELYDTSGDGWNKAALVVKYSDGTPDEAFTILDGKTKTYKRKIANDVEVTLEWVKGSWDLENSFIIKNENGNVIYQDGGFLNNGFIYSWINNCSCLNNSFDMCEPIDNLKADVNKNSVILTWTVSNDQEFIKYEIYRDTKYLGETDGLSFVDSNIEHNRAFSYTYSVRPVYEDCNGSFKSILAQWGVNVNEYSNNANVNIYPNPANDKLYIVAETEIEDIVVYDVYGRLQDYKTTRLQGSVTVDVTKLNAGIYFIKINTNEGNIVKRIIKQ